MSIAPSSADREPDEAWSRADKTLGSRVIASLVDRDAPLLLVRSVLLRLLGLVYLSAFLLAALQAVPLLGEHGILPISSFLARVRDAAPEASRAYLELPTLFWFGYSDQALRVCAWLGVVLSALALAGVTNAAVQLALWLLYLSIVQVGQRFYGYGWESQLLETGAIAVFACPLLSVRPNARGVPFLAMLLFRWLAFRVFLGAGLIKIRGDSCWRDFTCLFTHYETQPNPNPLTPLFHFAPHWMLRVEVAVNHLVELVAPWFVFGPRRLRLLSGASMVAFQVLLILSGNLSFLNWLTIVPALACFDDAALCRLLPARWRGSRAGSLAKQPCSPAQRASLLAFAVVVTLLSIDPVKNLLSPEQAMNRSYDPLHLVNTYGAFGSVGKERYEVILEGTAAQQLEPNTKWLAYEFPCKPGDVRRRPCWISPYHLRLDWQMWFAALGDARREPWIVHLIYQLLTGDADIGTLLARNPFKGRTPPHFVRAEFYRYRLRPPFTGDGIWWERSRVGSYLPALSRDDPRLVAFLHHYGWAAGAPRRAQ